MVNYFSILNGEHCFDNIVIPTFNFRTEPSLVILPILTQIQSIF